MWICWYFGGVKVSWRTKKNTPKITSFLHIWCWSYLSANAIYWFVAGFSPTRQLSEYHKWLKNSLRQDYFFDTCEPFMFQFVFELLGLKISNCFL
jgi:hypothetical protein